MTKVDSARPLPTRKSKREAEAVVDLSLGPVVRGPELATILVRRRGALTSGHVEHHAGEGVDGRLVLGAGLHPAKGPICSAS